MILLSQLLKNCWFFLPLSSNFLCVLSLVLRVSCESSRPHKQCLCFYFLRWEGKESFERPFVMKSFLPQSIKGNHPLQTTLYISLSSFMLFIRTGLCGNTDKSLAKEGEIPLPGSSSLHKTNEPTPPTPPPAPNQSALLCLFPEQICAQRVGSRRKLGSIRQYAMATPCYDEV